MVHVSNRAHVHVGLGTRKFLFSHFSFLQKDSKSNYNFTAGKSAQHPNLANTQPVETGAHCGNRTRDLSLTKGVLCH